MKNTITLTIPFSFKGEQYSPSTVIDLDQFCQHKPSLDSLAHTVATENDIGNYTYEYEVLLSSEYHFSDATGLAKKFLTDNNFDFESYRQALEETQTMATLQNIAKNNLGIENLEDHQDLLHALKQALEAGKSI